MDILKVLSRGTKKTNKFSSHNTTKLPSAGTKTNPQLFHDEIRGQKRKQQSCSEPETFAPAHLPEVDFFAPKDDESAETSAIAKQHPAIIPAAAAGPKPQQLDENECRQLLRSHRLKITLLSKPAEDQSSRVKKSKKKKVAAVETNKEQQKKQLFPQPLNSFGELRSVHGISDTVAENLIHQGFREPTEVQLGSLPILLRPDLALPGEGGLEGGVDFLAVAPTGSGKTISFLLTAINCIMRRRREQQLEGIHELEAIVVAPTRELAFQIVNEGRKLLQGTELKIVAMKKGMTLSVEQQKIDENDGDEDDEEEEDDDEDASESEHDSDGDEKTNTKHMGKGKGKGNEKNGCKPGTITKTDILVCTPMHLLNFLTSGPSDTTNVLPSVRDLVLDEADVLLDPLFREQTLGIWTACTSPNLRISCWSATMGSNIESLVTDRLKSRAESLNIPLKPLVRLVVGLKDTAVPNITHKLTYTASEQGKLLALRQLLRPASTDDSGPPLRPPFLVFTQTIDRATALHDELKYDIPVEAGGSSRIAALHSGLPDSARAAIMRRFRAGEVWVLITTDVLARGVDFAGVNGVVNYDVPGSSAAYVHRAGRTGRAGREGGVAVTFYTKEDIPFVKMVANVIAASEKQAGKNDGGSSGGSGGVQKWLLDALPNVNKKDRKMLREKGVAERRSGSKAKITSTSGFQRRKDNNKEGAIQASKKQKKSRRAYGEEEEDEEWGGFD